MKTFAEVHKRKTSLQNSITDREKDVLDLIMSKYRRFVTNKDSREALFTFALKLPFKESRHIYWFLNAGYFVTK